jgi:hypothetical protein
MLAAKALGLADEAEQPLRVTSREGRHCLSRIRRITYGRERRAGAASVRRKRPGRRRRAGRLRRRRT